MRRFCPVIAVVVVFCKSAAAQFPYEVPYMPTPQVVVDEMLRLVGPGDFMIDLGSGDGRILISAAGKFGARGFSVDPDAELVQESLENARAAGLEDRIGFVVVDNADRENEASLCFDGRATGNAMEGMVRRGVGKERTSQKWRALRIDS